MAFFYSFTECRMASFRGTVYHLPTSIANEVKRMVIDKETQVDHNFEEELLQLAMPCKDETNSQGFDTLDDPFVTTLEESIRNNPTMFP